MIEFDHVLFDIGGVLGSNGWDREQRQAAIERFSLDAEDFQYRHEETVGAFESGQISLDEYLDVTVFCAPRPFSRGEFERFMFGLSTPFPESIRMAQAVKQCGARMATLNNESRELNEYRIERFGLRHIFDVFFSSCWLGVRKPTGQIYERVIGMLQAAPPRTLFIDDREQNLAPARAVGLQTIHFRDARQLAADLVKLGFTV